MLKQNVALARLGNFDARCHGVWTGSVSEKMGGYRQHLEFKNKGDLCVRIMRNAQNYEYTVDEGGGNTYTGSIT